MSTGEPPHKIKGSAPHNKVVWKKYIYSYSHILKIMYEITYDVIKYAINYVIRNHYLKSVITNNVIKYTTLIMNQP